MPKLNAAALLFVFVVCILFLLGRKTPDANSPKVSTPSVTESSRPMMGEEKNPIQVNLGNEKEDLKALMQLRSLVQEPPSPRN
jgi:hypothetical protein